MPSHTDFPLHYAAPATHLFSDDGSIPNNPKLPLLVYPCEDADSGQNIASLFEDRFHANNWTGAWRNGIYTYHHYHSLSHEALAVYSGEATVLFGGESGKALTLKRGDVVVIPAGVGHKKLESSGDFGVVGAYPDGAITTFYGAIKTSVRKLSKTFGRYRYPLPTPSLARSDPYFGSGAPHRRQRSIPHNASVNINPLTSNQRYYENNDNSHANGRRQLERRRQRRTRTRIHAKQSAATITVFSDLPSRRQRSERS